MDPVIAVGADASSRSDDGVGGDESATHHGSGTGHATAGFYWTIGLILAVITATEVAVFYIEAMAGALVPILLLLSTAKFILVVMFFMHLKFDSKVLTTVFLAGLVLAVLMMTILILLYQFVPRMR